MPIITLHLPVKVISEGNVREHYHVSGKRHRLQKKWIQAAFLTDKPKINLPCKITLIRCAPRKLDDDNLQFAFKWVRDAVANELIPGKAAGRADDSASLSWHYAQEKGEGIKIVFEFAD